MGNAKVYQLYVEKRAMALSFVDKTNVNYYVTHFLMSRPSEAKLSLLHKHISEQILSQFPFYKTAFASSTSQGNWQTLKNKFVGVKHYHKN